MIHDLKFDKFGIRPFGFVLVNFIWYGNVCFDDYAIGSVVIKCD